MKVSKIRKYLDNKVKLTYPQPPVYLEYIDMAAQMTIGTCPKCKFKLLFREVLGYRGILNRLSADMEYRLENGAVLCNRCGTYSSLDKVGFLETDEKDVKVCTSEVDPNFLKIKAFNRSVPFIEGSGSLSYLELERGLQVVLKNPDSSGKILDWLNKPTGDLGSPMFSLRSRDDFDDNAYDESDFNDLFDDDGLDIDLN